MLNRGFMGVLRVTRKCLQMPDSSEERANRPHITQAHSGVRELKLEEFDSGGGPVRIHVRSMIVSGEQVNDTHELGQLSSSGPYVFKSEEDFCFRLSVAQACRAADS